MKTLRYYAATGLAMACAAIIAMPSRPNDNLVVGDNTFSIPTGKGRVWIHVLDNDIFRVSGTPDRKMVALPRSQSAVMSPADVAVNSFITPDSVMLVTATTSAHVDRRTGDVTFFDSEGDLLLAEAGGVDNSYPRRSVSFETSPGEFFYGAGERGHSLTLNGDTLSMYNRQNYGYTGSDPRISQMGISVPYLVSDIGYGILFDDYNKASLSIGDTLTYATEIGGKPLSYYFINGHSSLEGATEGYTRLTGRQSLPPFWSLGYVTSKYGYHNQAEAVGAIDSLKTRDYPVDGIVLDLYWYGKETDMGRLAWDSVQWPDHRAMLSDLRERGVNMVLISQPYINKIGAIDNYNYLSSKGMLAKDADGNTHDVTTWVGDAGMLDVSNPKTREWLWTRLRDLTSEGVAGWWGDLGEPEVHPSTIVHHNGETAEEYHNVYGNEWSRLIYEGLRRDFPDMRPMLMMRGGTAGLQRYSVFPWTTDVSRSWGGLEPQIRLMLSSGLSGLAYMSSDLGGFAVDSKQPTDPELYVRWLEMGAFTPMMRTHAQTKPEPYHYPRYESISRDYIKMRYRWLPYNYTLAYENATRGLPLARPLNFVGDNPESVFAEIDDEYLWGDEVLVAPVITKGARSRKVTFPAGEWISWQNPSLRYKGGTTAIVKAPLGHLPLFVKAGSFIPQYVMPIENVTEYNPQFLTVRYYPSAENTEYTLFDDNRLSPTSLEDGAYQLTRFSGVETSSEISVSLSASRGVYDGMPRTRQITLEIIGVSKAPESVSLNGVALDRIVMQESDTGNGWTWSRAEKTLTVRINWDYTAADIIVAR